MSCVRMDQRWQDERKKRGRTDIEDKAGDAGGKEADGREDRLETHVVLRSGRRSVAGPLLMRE